MPNHRAKAGISPENILRRLVSKTWKPFLSRYLSKPRHYRYKGIRLIIAPSVFHPGFFFSTRLLVRYLERYDLQGKSLLELGAGSGLISFLAAGRGAVVTATDINPIAVEYLEKNQQCNPHRFSVLHSDLFHSLPRQVFDFIIINPPYYKKKPQTAGDYAWYCGEQGEYFELLFQDLNHYIYAPSVVIMILSDDCDQDMINGMAEKHHFVLQKLSEKKIVWERNSLFQIKPAR